MWMMVFERRLVQFDLVMTLFRPILPGGPDLFSFRKRRTWAIAVRRDSYESLFLLNSGRFSLENEGNSVLNFGSLKPSESLWPKFFPL